MFQEMRSYMGLETTRGWTKQTVLRGEPSLFAVYSMVVCQYSLMAEEDKKQEVGWAGKKERTFSDAITSVRKWLWKEWVFVAAGENKELKKLSQEAQEMLLAGLAPAA
jgi:hypothetical protein